MNRICLPFIIFTLTVFCAVTIVKNADKSGSLRQIGAWDFLSFYAGAAVLKEGGNPYSQAAVEAKMLSLERPEGYFHGALRNPPWIFAVMAPVFAVEFPLANNLWLALNCSFALFTAIIIWMLCARKESLAGAALAAFVFAPALEVLAWGNIGLLCALGLALFFYAERRNRDLLAGAALLLPLLKPHLFLVWAIALAYWIVRYKRYRIVVGFISSASILTAAIELLRPGTLGHFLRSFLTSSKHSAQYINATVGDALEILLRPGVGEAADALPYLLTMLAMIGIAAYLLIKRPAMDLLRSSPALLCISLAAAPYGWFHDQSILVVAQAAIAGRAYYSNRRAFVALISLQLIAFGAKLLLEAQHQFFWLPVAMLALIYFFRGTDQPAE